jgi:polar amino acid transport system substrate-binding protein
MTLLARRPVAALLVSVGLLAGCSSSSKDTTAATDAPVAAETTAAPAAETTAAPAAETTAAPEAAETTAAAAAAGGDIKLVKPGQVTVCSDIPYAPFEYYENGADGAVIGIDADLIGAITADNGLKSEFIKTPFDGIFAALAAGSCDIIASSVSITDERKKANDFTDPYFTIQQTIMTRSADAATLTDTPALKGKKVGAQSATTGADFAKAEGAKNGFEVTEFQGADEMIAALKAGQVDAVIQDSPINGYAATQSNGELVVTKVFDGAGEAYGFVVPKTNPALTAAMNASLTELKDSGKYKEIVTKYLGAAAAG